MALPGSREAAWPLLRAPDYFTDQLATELADNVSYLACLRESGHRSTKRYRVTIVTTAREY